MLSLRSSIANVYHNTICNWVTSRPKFSQFTVLGIRRSGNHAIINWIQQDLPGLSCFCNDLIPKQKPIEAPIKNSKWNRGKQVSLICSYEDQPVESIFNRNNLRPNIENYLNLLILRDPYNLFASWIAWQSGRGDRFRADPNYRSKMINLWKNHAKLYVSHTSQGVKNIFIINYNHWFKSTEYRLALAQNLGLTGSTLSIPTVQNFGGGSSFDGLTYRNTPRMMNVTERWRNFTDHPIFKEIKIDEELAELTSKIFDVSNLSLDL